jgi:hypothetical protein
MILAVENLQVKNRVASKLSFLAEHEKYVLTI